MHGQQSAGIYPHSGGTSLTSLSCGIHLPFCSSPFRYDHSNERGSEPADPDWIPAAGFKYGLNSAFCQSLWCWWYTRAKTKYLPPEHLILTVSNQSPFQGFSSVRFYSILIFRYSSEGFVSETSIVSPGQRPGYLYLLPKTHFLLGGIRIKLYL